MSDPMPDPALSLPEAAEERLSRAAARQREVQAVLLAAVCSLDRKLERVLLMLERRDG